MFTSQIDFHPQQLWGKMWSHSIRWIRAGMCNSVTYGSEFGCAFHLVVYHAHITPTIPYTSGDIPCVYICRVYLYVYIYTYIYIHIYIYIYGFLHPFTKWGHPQVGLTCLLGLFACSTPAIGRKASDRPHRHRLHHLSSPGAATNSLHHLE